MPMSKTILPADRDVPQVKALAAALRRFVWKMFLRGEPFALDKKYPDARFTFGSLFLKRV